MKILCVCQGGTVRSGAMAWVLKHEFDQDALAGSHDRNSPETLAMLTAWADRIVLMQPHFIGRIPEEHRAKVKVVDVGVDRWSNCLHPDLLTIVRAACKEWKKEGWKV